MAKVRPLILTHLVSTLVLWALVRVFIAPQQALSSLFASAIVGFNLWIWMWSLGRIFAKKSVALGVSLIVIKYAALMVLLIILLSQGWRADLGFLVGLSSLFPTVGVLAYQHQKQLKNDGAF